jgi:hypothetical protein
MTQPVEIHSAEVLIALFETAEKVHSSFEKGRTQGDY